MSPPLKLVLVGHTNVGKTSLLRTLTRDVEFGEVSPRASTTRHVEGARQYATRAVSRDTLVIHGAADTTVPLANVLAWAEPLELPVVVIPGADHFFHRRLHIIRDIILRAWSH